MKLVNHPHTIHHYEDEPELLRWIPSVLLNRFWSRFPDWIRNEGNFAEHDDNRTTFELTLNGQTHLIEYRLYNGVKEFERHFTKLRAQDVALIDVMEGGINAHGLHVYAKAIQKLRLSRRICG